MNELILSIAAQVLTAAFIAIITTVVRRLLEPAPAA
jgi:hypothetical protein